MKTIFIMAYIISTVAIAKPFQNSDQNQNSITKNDFYDKELRCAALADKLNEPSDSDDLRYFAAKKLKRKTDRNFNLGRDYERVFLYLPDNLDDNQKEYSQMNCRLIIDLERNLQEKHCSKRY